MMPHETLMMKWQCQEVHFRY